jgi:isochorismate hydrolase
LFQKVVTIQPTHHWRLSLALEEVVNLDEIDPKKTAMIVVDMQNDFVASGAAMETPAAREIVPRLAEALRICRDAGIKIIYTAPPGWMRYGAIR